MESPPDTEISHRIAQIRLEIAGSRGKSLFAKKLGIPTSTYDYYETARVPPADVLLKIADIAGIDLRWLITGQAAAPSAVPLDHPILHRAAKLLSQHPDSARALAAFLDLLEKSLQFPARTSDQPSESASPQAAATAAASTTTPAGSSPPGTQLTPRPQPPNAGASGDQTASYIPILGRSAAGVPHFWADDAQAQGITTLDELIARHASDSRQVRPAVLSDGGRDQSVQVVTLRSPNQDDLVEFISCPALKAAHPDAFAVRIDGDSMSPDIRHGDLVVLSPSAAARDGRAAVVQLRRQVGVTCKLWRLQAGRVYLAPINDSYETFATVAKEVVWALRVLARIRP